MASALASLVLLSSWSWASGPKAVELTIAPAGQAAPARRDVPAGRATQASDRRALPVQSVAGARQAVVGATSARQDATTASADAGQEDAVAAESSLAPNGAELDASTPENERADGLAQDWAARFDQSAPSKKSALHVLAALPPAKPLSTYAAPLGVRLQLALSRAGMQAAKYGAVAAMALAAPVSTLVSATAAAIPDPNDAHAESTWRRPLRAWERSPIALPPVDARHRQIQAALAELARRSGDRRNFDVEVVAERYFAVVQPHARGFRANPHPLAKYFFGSLFVDSMRPAGLAGSLAHEHAHVVVQDKEFRLAPLNLLAWTLPSAVAEVALAAVGFAWLSATPVSLPLAAGLLLAGAALALASHLLTLALSRARERRADHLAAWLTAPELMEAAIEDIDEGGRTWTAMLDTHPSNAERLQRLRRDFPRTRRPSRGRASSSPRG